METHTPAISSNDPSVMNPLPERPKQGKFSKEETDFLQTHIPAYRALCDQLEGRATGPGSVKGRKKDWILLEVYPRFVKQFLSDQNGGPQLQSLQEKIVRWFTNHSPHRYPGDSKVLATVISRATSRRPRATNGASVFAEENKLEITERMAEEQAQEGGIPRLVNLRRYHTAKQELYGQLTEEERHAYETKAAKKNEECKAPPEVSKVFENQGNIVVEVMKALRNLIGWDWGQHGEAIFFVQGAYRNAEHDLKTFNVSVGSNPKITSFSLTLPDYKDKFRAPFREWAGDALPALDRVPDIANQKYAVNLLEDGSPCLPAFDINLIAPTDARSLLKAYIELSWKFATKPGVASDAVPWNLLDTVALRRNFLVKPEAFSHVTTMDPMRMSLPEIYSILTFVVEGQASGVRVLEFLVGNSETDTELEISELLDSPTQVPEPPASPRDRHINNVSTAFDHEAPPCKSSPPLSESPIRVAEAGHLHIIPMSQQGENTETGSSHSKKRRREETERNGPNDRETKKHVGKKAVPPREQSSRLKNANYKNKHVTVRPR